MKEIQGELINLVRVRARFKLIKLARVCVIVSRLHVHLNCNEIISLKKSVVMGFLHVFFDLYKLS